MSQADESEHKGARARLTATCCGVRTADPRSEDAGEPVSGVDHGPQRCGHLDGATVGLWARPQGPAQALLPQIVQRIGDGGHGARELEAIFCAPQQVDLSIINGRIVVEDGELRTMELGPLIERHNQISTRMING